MGRFIKLFLLPLVLLIVGIAAFFRISAENVYAQNSKNIRIGIYDNPPKIYTDAYGNITGVYGDILSFISQQEGWQITYVNGTFDEGLKRLAAGEIDAMVDVAVSSERQKLYDFTNKNVLSSWGAVYVPQGSMVDSFDDLDNKKVGILKGSIYESGPEGVDQYIRAFNLNVNFIEYPQYPQIFADLNDRKIDAAVVSSISGISAQKEYPGIKPSGIVFSPSELRFALTKGNPNNPYWIERLDYWIEQLHTTRNDVYRKILDKNNLSGYFSQVSVVPSWVLPAALGSIALILFAWILVITYKRARSAALTQLAEKEQYLGKIIANTPVAILAYDTKGIVTLAEGKSIENLTNDQQIKGKSIFELYKNDPEIVKYIGRTLEGKEVEFPFENKNYYFQILASSLKSGKNIFGGALVAIDTTKEKELEQAKTDFLHTVQHQLRTPPGIMKWSMEVLSPKISGKLNEDDKKYWQMLDTEITRMINLANSLTLVSQAETGNLMVKKEKINLGEMIKNIESEFDQMRKDKKLEIIEDYRKAPMIVQDKSILGVAFRALISNAIIYSKPENKIQISLTEKPDSIFFSVKDLGEGIPKKEQIKIFTRLNRGALAEKVNPEGLGLGLYLTKLLISQINGRVWFESIPGEGSIFYLEFPKR